MYVRRGEDKRPTGDRHLGFFWVFLHTKVQQRQSKTEDKYVAQGGLCETLPPPRPRYWQHTGICFLKPSPALGKWKERVSAGTPIPSHATALSRDRTLHLSCAAAWVQSSFASACSHLPWAERRVRGTWRGWAVWACWRRLRRRQRVHRSLCTAPPPLAAPTAVRHSWRKMRRWTIKTQELSEQIGSAAVLVHYRAFVSYKSAGM